MSFFFLIPPPRIAKNGDFLANCEFYQRLATILHRAWGLMSRYVSHHPTIGEIISNRHLLGVMSKKSAKESSKNPQKIPKKSPKNPQKTKPPYNKPPIFQAPATLPDASVFEETTRAVRWKRGLLAFVKRQRPGLMCGAEVIF